MYINRDPNLPEIYSAVFYSIHVYKFLVVPLAAARRDRATRVVTIHP